MGKKLEVVKKVFKGGKKALGSMNKALQSETAKNMSRTAEKWLLDEDESQWEWETKRRHGKRKRRR